MSETINSIDVYVTKVRGTATSYIRVASVNTNDVAAVDASETSGASTSGIQVVDFGGVVVGGNATGLANDATTYTGTITIDDTAYPISVVGSAAQTFTNLITELNADLPNTEAAIDGDGNITITSTGTGNNSYISIVDVDVFSSLTGYLAISDAVDGGLLTELKSDTLGNGKSAFYVYESAQEVYDTGANATIIDTAYTVSDLNDTFNDEEVEADLGSIKVKLDALQALVNKLLN